MAFNWKTFWYNIKQLGDDEEQRNQVNPDVRKWEDISKYNPLDIVVKKLGTLVNDEATFELGGDSDLIEPLRVLCNDLEAKRYDICSMMLGKGGCWVTMATNEDTEPYHRIIAPADVSVYNISADKIYEMAMIIDRKTIKKQKYTLVRHHILDKNGTLYVYYYTLDNSGREAFVEEWEHYKSDNTAFYNAKHIGVAYFKSPQDSNGLEPFFGVPLNFACKEEEAKLIEAKQMLSKEMQNAKMKLFADKSITRIEQTEMGNVYGLPEDVYVIQKKSGIDGGLIDEFAPATRYNDYKQNMIDAGHDYEDRIGLNAGFVTPPEYTAGATATEIRTANVKTISMMKKVRNAMYEGIKETLIADNILSLIPLGLWDLKVDWFDPFVDETAQYERIKTAAQDGYAEAEDVVRWLFPDLSQQEIEEKLARISATNQANTERAIENIISAR